MEEMRGETSADEWENIPADAREDKPVSEQDAAREVGEEDARADDKAENQAVGEARDDRERAWHAYAERMELGKPGLVCRWRLASCALPAANRHLRALASRTVNGRHLDRELCSWAKQHIEWTLEAGAAEHPDGVLMLVVDDQGRAAMTVGPYQPLGDTTVPDLARRARLAQREAQETGVAPETLWLVRGHDFVAGLSPRERPSGIATLMLDLAKSLGLGVERDPAVLEEVLVGKARYDEAFLVSDEHGVVPASDASGSMAERMAGSYQRLLEKTGRR